MQEIIPFSYHYKIQLRILARITQLQQLPCITLTLERIYGGMTTCWLLSHRARFLFGLSLAGLLVGCQTPVPPTPPPLPSPAHQSPRPRLPDPEAPPPARTSVTKPAIATKTRPVLIIKPSSSVPVDSERSYAEKVSDRLRNWVESVGIPVTQLSDDQFAAGKGQDARVAILPYNSTLNSRELQACRRFVKDGGKLIILFSADPNLASLMGIRLGPAMRAPGADSWNQFHFTGSSLQGAPPKIEQTSLTLRPAYPAGQNSQVIAWWDSSSGKLPREPAWIQSNHGFWMSHILLESDVPAKKQLLISLLGACDRSLWQAAAAQALNRAGQLGQYPSATQAIETIRSQAKSQQASLAAEPLLARAETLQHELRTHYQTGNYPETLQAASRLDATLTEAYASIQSPAEHEFRGVWNHSGTGFVPGSWDQTCQALSRAGMTAILPHVQRPWCAHYPSRLVPASDSLTRYGDQMAACTAAAKRHGLDVHAWVILWNLEGAPDSALEPYRKAGRLQHSSAGTPIPWLCPSHPANRTFELALITELATRYPQLDGIHLDYTRFKTQDYCYCKGCQTRFVQATGTAISRWPADVRSGPKQAAYRQWRRDLLTRFVGEVHQKLKQLNPTLKLSASVYPVYPGVRESIAQDWGEWLRLGFLDFACPMSYTGSTEKFTDWYRKQVSYPGVKGKVYAGIGVTSMECRLNAVQTMTQIATLRQEGASGFTLFDANPTLENDILPYLRKGLTK
jgi:uncharacterized lipoprotein YddW (UPF0748 family)